MTIRQKFASSSAWVAVGNGADNAIQFLIFAVLARLLSVSDVGLVALGMVAIDVLRVIASAGTAEAVIRKAEWDETFSATAFWLNIALSIVICIVALPVLFLTMRANYTFDQVGAMAALFGLLIVDSARAVHVAKLRKEFNFRSIAVRSVLSGTVSGIAAIVLAYLGAGIWSLVAQRVIYSCLTTLQTWRASRWIPMRRFSRPVFVKLIPFTVKILGSRIIDIGTQKLPDFVIGAVLGTAALGFYKVGSRALDAIFQMVIKPVQFATLPALSAASSSDKLRDAIVRMTQFFAIVICPAMLGSGILANDLVKLLFTDRYAASGAIMQILSISALPATLSFFIGPALVVRNRTGLMLALSGSQILFAALAMGLLTRYSIQYAAWAVVLGQYLWLPGCIYVLSRAFGLEPKIIVTATLRPFVAAIIMALALKQISYLVLDWHAVIRLGFLSGAGTVIYIICLRVLFPQTFDRFLKEAAGVLPRKKEV